MTGRDADVVAVAQVSDGLKLRLEVLDLGHTRAAEEIVGDRVRGETALAEVEAHVPLLRQQAPVSDGHRRDAADVAAVCTALADDVADDRVVGDPPPAHHHAPGRGAAVEQDALVLLIAVIVVPVQHRRGIAGGELQGVHGDRVAHVHLACRCDASVIHLTEQHAWGNAELLLHFHPTAEGQCVHPVLLDDVVQDHAQLDEVVERLGRHRLPGCVRLESGGLVLHLRVRGLQGLKAGEDIGEVQRLDGDAVTLERDLVDAHGLEGGGPRADRADRRLSQAVAHPTEAIEVDDVGGKSIARGMDRMRAELPEIDKFISKLESNTRLSDEENEKLVKQVEQFLRETKD